MVLAQSQDADGRAAAELKPVVENASKEALKRPGRREKAKAAANSL